MEERQVTVDGVTMPLPRPFMVIATQNPVELHGTFPLPEAQLDRFFLRLELGYPSIAEEDAMLLRFESANPIESLSPVTSPSEIAGMKELSQKVRIEESVRRYILDIIQRTRNNASISLGASPRASLFLYKGAQALAMVKGRDYVIPDDVKRLAAPVLSHRIILSNEAYLHKRSKESILGDILNAAPVPVEP
jgi:MoxR-like ATPase